MVMRYKINFSLLFLFSLALIWKVEASLSFPLPCINNVNLIQQKAVDKDGISQVTTYDALNRIQSIIKSDDFGNKLAEQHLHYDNNDNKILERHIIYNSGDPVRSYTIAWTYDALNRITSISEGVESPQQRNTYYHYNSLGQLETIIKPNGVTLVHVYNGNGYLSSLKASDQSLAYQYFYDKKGNLVEVKDLIYHTSLIRRYNDLNQLIEESLAPSLTLKNVYDLAGRRIQLIFPDKSSIRYHYEGFFLQSIMRFSATQECLYQHEYCYDNKTGAVISSQLIDNLGAVTYSYDQKGQSVKIQSPWWSETIPQEGFDPYGRLTQLSIQDPAGQIDSQFTYTNDHQLASEKGYFSHDYSYDSLYNRLISDYQPWSINALNQVVQTADAEYQYDVNGNICQKRQGETCWIYEYDALNRLVRVTQNHQKAVEYHYDTFHRQFAQLIYVWSTERSQWKLESTEYFLYDGNKEIGRLDASGKMIELRVLGLEKGSEIGAAIACELGERFYAPIHDHQGSVRCLIDTNTRSVAEFYRYSAYGLEEIFNEEGSHIQTSSVGNPWRFSSKRYDSQTGFIFFDKRYYDPQIGLWITPDPIITLCDIPNSYVFAQNNPLTTYDLYGLFSMNSMDLSIYGLNFYLFEKAYTDVKMTGKKFLDEWMTLLADQQFGKTEAGIYGKKEISGKVRVTFINGILTTHKILQDNLELISRTHQGVKVHYIFRPTEGWMRDLFRAVLIKMAFALGFRFVHAQLLAQTWKNLIQDMGGVNGGGLIIHYAHSLGGSDTDRARELLTPEEQKMIRVISLGSATMIRNKGFESVINYVSPDDLVSYLDPLGRVRNFFDPECNIIFSGESFDQFPPGCDHLLNGRTYKPILEHLGQRFVLEFSSK